MAKKPIPCLCSHARSNRDPQKGHFAKKGRCKVPNCACEAYRSNLDKQEKDWAVIPRELLDEDMAVLQRLRFGSRGFTVDAYKTWCRRKGGSNSRSVRYQDMEKAGDLTGENVGMTALVTRHSVQESRCIRTRNALLRFGGRLSTGWTRSIPPLSRKPEVD